MPETLPECLPEFLPEILPGSYLPFLQAVPVGWGGEVGMAAADEA
ncbi:MAG: hypothetical protein ACXVDF_07780 [Ktedonobacterales bacterium]